MRKFDRILALEKSFLALKSAYLDVDGTLKYQNQSCKDLRRECMDLKLRVDATTCVNNLLEPSAWVSSSRVSFILEFGTQWPVDVPKLRFDCEAALLS